MFALAPQYWFANAAWLCSADTTEGPFTSAGTIAVMRRSIVPFTARVVTRGESSLAGGPQDTSIKANAIGRKLKAVVMVVIFMMPPCFISPTWLNQRQSPWARHIWDTEPTGFPVDLSAQAGTVDPWILPPQRKMPISRQPTQDGLAVVLTAR